MAGNTFVDGLWDDVRALPTVRTAGGNAPSFSQYRSTNIYFYVFSGTLLKEVFFTVQLPHRYKEGTDIVPHVHFVCETTQTGDLKWGLDYSWANAGTGTAGVDLPTTTNITALVTYGSSIQYKHTIHPFAAISGTGKKVSSIITGRLYRDGTDGADTFNADVDLIEFDFHFQQDAIGSINSYNKP